MGDKRRGLYRKYDITRTDGRSAAGEKHYLCDYFVLDLKHDPYARKALLAYAEACRSRYPILSSDLFDKADEMLELPEPPDLPEPVQGATGMRGATGMLG
jgi:hypothetical protein